MDVDLIIKMFDQLREKIQKADNLGLRSLNGIQDIQLIPFWSKIQSENQNIVEKTNPVLFFFAHTLHAFQI